METLEEYRTRLLADGLKPFDKLAGVVEAQLHELSERERKMAEGKAVALSVAIILIVVSLTIYALENDPFVSLLSGIFAMLTLLGWWSRKRAQDGLIAEMNSLKRLLGQANFEVLPSAGDDRKPAVRWKRKEARLYA